jgi:hypothetical protein
MLVSDHAILRLDLDGNRDKEARKGIASAARYGAPHLARERRILRSSFL